MTVSRITSGMSDIVEPRNDRGRLRPTRALGVAAVWRSCLLMLAFVGLGFATSPADAAWYDTNWQFRKSIIIDRTQVIGTQTDFPVLISITDADLAAAARADGFDILFTDDDGAAKLDHEIERYVSATGELVAWVKVPSISAAPTRQFTCTTTIQPRPISRTCPACGVMATKRSITSTTTS